MHKFARYSILPLLLLNGVLAANLWEFMGLILGRPLYWLAILLAAFVVFYSCYRKLALLLVVGGIFFQFLEVYPSSELVDSIAIFFRKLCTASLFIISSAIIYGENPRILSRQLNCFLVLCIPFMILQIAGAHYWFFSWDEFVPYTIQKFDGVNELKDIPLYPTLFVPLEELYYQQRQGRPFGLLHSNNLLSAFIVCALVLNLYWHKHAKITLTDIAVNMVAVLTMSKLVILFTLILYSFASISRVAKFRTLGLKNLFIFANCLVAYFIFFPGMFFSHFDLTVYTRSFLYRFLDMIHALGLSDSSPWIEEVAIRYDILQAINHTFTGVSVLLKYHFFAPLFILFLLSYFAIRRKMRIFLYFSRRSQEFYTLLYLAALICISTLPVLRLPLIQFIFGLGLFPFLTKFWARRIDRVRPSV